MAALKQVYKSKFVEVIMTEREKMLEGQLYGCGDAELLTQWHKAKDLARNYLCCCISRASPPTSTTLI